MKLAEAKIAQSIYCSIVFGMLLFFGSKTALASNDHLAINEVYPCPKTGETEWIELYNPTDSTINLQDYLLASKHGSLPEEVFNLPDINFPSKSFFVLATDEEKFFNTYKFNSSFKLDNIILANSDDYIALRLKSDGSNTDAVAWGENYGNIISYSKTIASGHSIEREPLGSDTDDCSKDFVDRELPTPGAEYSNIIDEVKDETIKIKEARDLENGEDVTIIGAVTSLPGVLSSQYFYIQDGTSGIQIYCYYKAFPALVLGESISVTGELSETNNERRVKISSADSIIILNHIEPVVPAEIAISEINEKNEGTYIKTMGIVIQTSGDTFYISDGQTEIKVVINKSTGIEKPKMKKGDQVEVTGIISQYKEEYRILPIDQNDVKIIASEGQLPRAGSTELFYFIISLFLSILWNIYLEAKRKPTP